MMKDIEFRNEGKLVKSVPQEQIEAIRVDSENRVYVDLKKTGGATTEAKIVAYVGSNANQELFLTHLQDCRESLRNAVTSKVTIDSADLDFVTSIVNS